MADVRVAVIGGGIIGASVLYHLAKRGWTDSVLLEKSVLTAGSTWHAAANGNTMNPVANISRLQKRSIDLYAQLEAETGQSVGIHRPGGFMIATTGDRMNEYKTTYALGRRLGFDYELISPDELSKRHILTNTENVIGALYDPLDGHIDPYGATQALAKGARQLGASIREGVEVLELHAQPDGSWRIVTNQGEIHSEWIVNAAGLWANGIAKMTGTTLPMTPMEHHYLVTENIPEIEALDYEIPLIRDPDASFYMRQEQKGLLLGIYESDAKPWNPHGVPNDFGQELLQSDIDRLMPNLEKAFLRFPVLESAGIKREVNGPFVFTPDGRPLVGPMPGQRNHFCAAGFLAGLNMGGGFGDVIAEWIIDGRTDYDLSSCDVARFGAWADIDYSVARAIDTYSHRYHQHYPHEERSAGRPSRTFPLYEKQKQNGAVFGAANGWERPLWYAPKGVEPRDTYSFGRQNWFHTVGEEARAVRRGCGISDVSVFAKYKITGKQATSFLNRLLAAKLPTKPGITRLAHMLDYKGGMIGEFSIMLKEEGSYFLVGASAAENIHFRWMEKVAVGFDCQVKVETANYCVLAVAGPNSRELLQKLTNDDISNENFRFLNCRDIRIGSVPVFAIRVSFSGELGYELYCDPTQVVELYDTIKTAGSEFGIRDFGGRAMDSLRLEKAYPRAGSEINSEVTPLEAGLGFAVCQQKRGYIGYAAIQQQRDNQSYRWQLTTVLLEEGTPVDPIGNENVYRDGELVGYVTSGGFGFNIDRSIAKVLIKPDCVQSGCLLEVDILGNMIKVIVTTQAPYDPKGDALRS